MKTDDEELIRKRAYELWERAGRPEGDGLKYWFEAAEESQSAKINWAGMQENATIAGETAAVAKAKMARRSTAKKQPEDAKPLKRSAGSGDKKGKRTKDL